MQVPWTRWSRTNQPTPTVSKKFRAKTVSFNSLVIATSRGEGFRLNRRAVIKYFRRETRTFRRRARQRHTKTRRNAARGTQRGCQWRRQCAGGGKLPPPAILPYTRKLQQPMRAWSNPVPSVGDWTLLPVITLSSPAPSAQLTPEILILVHGSQFLSRASCREGCECIGKSEHNRTAHYIIDHPVETIPGIHDQASIVAADSIDQTVRTPVDMTPQGANLVLASKSQDGAVFRIRNSGIVYFDVFDQVERALLYTFEELAKN